MDATGFFPILAIVTIILLFRELIWSVLRTITSVILNRFDARPVRIDLRIPRFPIDMVFVTKADHIKEINRSPDVTRLSAFGFPKLPPWAQKYFPSTRFLTRKDYSWFLPLDPESILEHYPRRRKFYEDSFNKAPHTKEDILTVKELAEKGDDAALSGYLANMINHRFLRGTDVPPEIVAASKTILNKPIEALNPFKYRAALKANEQLADFVAKTKVKELTIGDCMHNVCAAGETFPKLIMSLKNFPNVDIDELFTRPGTRTTAIAPRIAVKASTYGDLLRYNAVPGKTIFILQVPKAATETSDILFAFGCGDEHRACAFLPYFKNFMKDLQNAFLEPV
eukprot:jgi/Botrbrau1/17152/Bobra.0157s0046.1